jgi:hypothetical protein
VHGDAIGEVSERAPAAVPSTIGLGLSALTPQPLGFLLGLVAGCCTEHPGDHATRRGGQV